MNIQINKFIYIYIYIYLLTGIYIFKYIKVAVNMKQYTSISTGIKIFRLTNQTETAFSIVLTPFTLSHSGFSI